jgi:hypothetical protein
LFGAFCSLAPNVGFLSNPEVLQIVKERHQHLKSIYRRGNKVELEAEKYLSEVTCEVPRDKLIDLLQYLKVRPIETISLVMKVDDSYLFTPTYLLVHNAFVCGAEVQFYGTRAFGNFKSPAKS